MTLVLDDVTVGYPGRPARTILRDVRLTAHAGQATALLGPNGAGKSTLLRSVAGLQRVLGGSVFLDGDDVTKLSPAHRARRIAVVLTDRVDGGLLTGGEVAALGRLPHQGFTSRLSADEKRLIADSLDRLGAAHLTDVRMHEMSDGQRQRILIARALVQQPALLVLDEPSAFLDVAARVELLALLDEIATDTGITVLLSTHDVELVLRTSQHVWLAAGDGTVVDGSPAELVESGAITRAFDSRRVHFDPRDGIFRLGGV
ncbi:ATP-binding cassette domain-containing protein [Rhodococcus hoagii]|uniref:ATP-binding cassette domain-containing protein n=1 Tax=Rhodococcus hoagii TaxID=43767 RepID=A0AAE2W3J5_RHOHA|nr:ABC transporter ATP-binding protein [Prescottella equi]MBM4482394.1 ATP-binding cassette domain-containing protein [Prescottella equi]MBM4539548.1 ATP-binding cassette domain-containing protein [Prescottella equi]MBM4713344.1 ATP-binding cassette domain-containing protein [Prescottella equi]NKR61414.1 ATP-binding cassette domain-containing protein [Prescottella equi]NKR92423.1 ATP-binding cassette domain-containing protein [Prescottella equi]